MSLRKSCRESAARAENVATQDNAKRHSEGKGFTRLISRSEGEKTSAIFDRSLRKVVSGYVQTDGIMHTMRIIPNGANGAVLSISGPMLKRTDPTAVSNDDPHPGKPRLKWRVRGFDRV